MQSYTDIQSSQSLQSSLSLLLNNDKTALSCSSGTAFPTSNLQAGMLCYRTDQKKLYLLQDVTPTWKLLLDMNTTGNAAASEGVQSFLLRNAGGADEGGELVLQKPVTGSTLSGNIAIDLYKDQLRIFDQGTSNGFHIDLKTGAASAATKIWHNANDGDGSGLDADLLDGKQSGNANGNIPVSNGTVNTNLNADMVDGKHVGNGSGQIPLSNGAANTDLNADMLDGYHASSFVRTIQGVAPDVSGNVSVDLASRVAKTGDTMTGNLTVTNGSGAIVLDKTGDLKVYRSGGTTGVLYLNSAGSRYLHFDGSYYRMPGAELYVNGGRVWRDGWVGVCAGAHLGGIHGGQSFSPPNAIGWSLPYITSVDGYGRVTGFSTYNNNCNCCS